MAGVNQTIHNVNATLRTLLMLVLVGGAGYAGYKAYDLYNEPQQQLADKQAELATVRGSLAKANTELAARSQEVAKLNSALEEKSAQVERMEVAMSFLKVRHRLAQLTVLDQRKRAGSDTVASAAGGDSPEVAEGDGDTAAAKNLITRLEFVEVNDEGNPISEAKQFEVVGDMVYVDYLRVTFDDKYVEQSDLDRSTAIALFQRIFGEFQDPVDGFHLDTVGTRPTAYARGSEMSEFERKIWDDFWLIANDSQRAAELGIHAAHGSAISMRVQPGQKYEIKLRSTGELTFRPIEKSAETAAETPTPRN